MPKKMSHEKNHRILTARRTFYSVLLAAGVLIMASILYADEPKPAGGQTNSVAANVKTPDAAAKPAAAKRQITGAELYSINCNRCHQERYPTERTGAQWKTIMLHMQVRANIPVSQAKLILQYLQENSGR